MTYHVKNVGIQLKKWQQVKDALAGDDLDIDTLIDTLDGETEIFEVLCAIKESALEDAMAIRSLDSFINDLKSRRARAEKAMKSKDAMILSAMERAEIPQVKGPLFTLSKRKVPPKVIINDEAEIPAKFFRSPDPVIDKNMIMEALKEKQDVPGAQLSNGGITLSTRII